MYTNKEEALIKRRENFLKVLQQIHKAKPQLIIGSGICRETAGMCKTAVYNIGAAAKYAMLDRTITLEDVLNFCKEEDYRKTHHKTRASKKTNINQLFAEETIVNHKELQPSKTTDVNIIDLKELAVQFLRSNNLKVLKIELREGITPLITFE